MSPGNDKSELSPEDVALLYGVSSAAWRQVGGHYPLEDASYVSREQLASIVVMLGQSWKSLEAD